MFLAGHPSQGCFGLQSHCAPCYFFNQASFYPSDFSFNVCSLAVVKGPCSGTFTQWYYDKDQEDCIEFVFSGCQGNANRFNTKESCYQRCKREKLTTPAPLVPDDVCALPQEPGPCLGYYRMWFYDASDKICKSFVYGGCEGNGNRFEKRTDCEASCIKKSVKVKEPIPVTPPLPRITNEVFQSTEDELHWCAKIKDEVEKLAYQLNEEAERTERPIKRLRTAIRGFSSGRPRGTTPADDRYIVLQARRNRRQIAGEIARHTTQATGRPISRFTVARRLHGGGLFARRPMRADSVLSSDSHRILIWRERVSRNHSSNIIERDRYGGRGVLVWGGIMLGSRTDLHIFDAGSVNGTRYCNEILLPYVRLFRGVMGLQFLFMDDNAPCHRTVAAEQLLESEDIERMDWPTRSPDLNPIEHVWDFLGRRLAARTLPPVTIRELRLALQDEWAAMP
ncbi:papilin [Trichonephila clavipes]|nr:papilin [Trichonephila clavipes]